MWANISVDLVFTEFSFPNIESVINSPIYRRGKSPLPSVSVFLPHSETVICISEPLGIVAKMGKGPVNPSGTCASSRCCVRGFKF